MSLRDDAIAAYRASQEDNSGQARAVLADVLAPEDVSALAVEDIEPGPGFVRFVFTDSDLHLAVVLRGGSNGEVSLVEGSPGDWTSLAAIDSLETLGKVIPRLVPLPPSTSGPDAWAAGVSYAVGDEVTYDGSTYRCVQSHTSQDAWTPAAVPALWELVT